MEAAEAGTHSNQCLCANLFTKLHRSLALAPFWDFFEVITARQDLMDQLLRRLKQEQKFKISLGYKVSSSAAWAIR